MQILLVWTFWLWCIAPKCVEGQTVSAAGNIEMERGAAADGLVYAQWAREGPPAPDVPQFGKTLVDKNGEFRVTDLRAGTYRLCVDAINQKLLDPCIWGAPLRVTVGSPASDISGLKLRLKRGARLQFHLNDPEGLLRGPENAVATGAVDMGVWLPRGEYIPMRTVKRGKNERVFEAIVPPMTHIRLQLRAVGVQIAQLLDAQDRDFIPFLDSAAGFAVTSGPAGRPKMFRLEVRRASR